MEMSTNHVRWGTRQTVGGFCGGGLEYGYWEVCWLKDGKGRRESATRILAADVTVVSSVVRYQDD
jgi:hypothetical protein